MFNIRERLGHGVASNVVSLYSAHFVNYILPLLTIPYLVRVLGVSSWGLLAIAQGLGNYLSLIVEYGFNLSATREVARNRHDPEVISDLVAGVSGARLLLAVAALLVAALFQRAIPGLQDHPRVFWASLLYGIALGLSPMWYFQGLERMKVVASLEVAAKVAAAAGLFIFVHSPEDSWRVPGLQATACFFSAGVGAVMMVRETPVRRMKLSAIRRALETGWTMFLFRTSVMLYTAGNSFILGFFATPTVVGYFAGAEKISKAFMGLLYPFNQAIYPRLSKLAKHDRKENARLLQLNAAVVAVAGLLLGVTVYVMAPFLVRMFLGRDFAPAAPVLRLLAVLPLLIGLNTVLCLQWMAPMGMDKVINRIILSAGLINICLAVVFAPRFQQMGMAYAVIGAESFVFLTGILVMLRVRSKGEARGAGSLLVSDVENPA